MMGVVLALALAADEAPQVPTGQRWSVVGAKTAGAGANVIEGGLGFPSASFTYLRGVSAGVDVGARASFTYGLEGLVTRIMPGAKVQGLVKVRLVDAQTLSIGVVFEPGPLFAVDRFGTGLVGFSLPVGFRLGVAVSSALSLGFSFDVPVWLQFGAGGGVNVPMLAGLGVEYFVTSRFAGFFRLRAGPTVRPIGSVELTFDAALGVAYRFE